MTFQFGVLAVGLRGSGQLRASSELWLLGVETSWSSRICDLLLDVVDGGCLKRCRIYGPWLSFALPVVCFFPFGDLWRRV